MRMVNIGFNVKTSDAVKDLKKFQSELIEIQKLVTDISKKSLDIKIDKGSIKNIASDMDKTAKAIQNSFKTSLSTLDEVIERANRAGATIGKNAKLDSTSASKYTEKLKEVIRTLEAIKQVDVSILDAKELTSLNVTTQQVIKTFNTLERDLDKFTETGVHSTKEVEKLSRKLEYMKKAVQEAFESSGKSNLEGELKKVSTQIDKNIDSLYKSIENIDYRELMKLQEEVKDTSKEYDKFVKLLKQPVKIEVEAPKDFGLKEVSKFYGKEAIYPTIPKEILKQREVKEIEVGISKSSLSTLQQALLRIDKMGENIGKNSKLDDRVMVKYLMKMNEVKKKGEEIAFVLSNPDLLKSFDQKEILNFKNELADTLKVIRKLDTDMASLESGGLKDIKRIENLTRQLDFLKKQSTGMQTTANLTGKSDMIPSLSSFDKQVELVRKSLSEAFDNIDPTNLMKAEDRIKNLVKLSNDLEKELKKVTEVKPSSSGVKLTAPKEGVLYGAQNIKESSSITSMRKELMSLILLSEQLDNNLSLKDVKGIENYKSEMTAMLNELSKHSINIGLGEEDIAKLKFKLNGLKSGLSSSYKIFDLNEKDMLKLDELKSKLNSISKNNRVDIFGSVTRQITKLESELVDLQNKLKNLGQSSHMPEFKSQIKGVEKELANLYKIQNPSGDFGGLSMLINKYTLLYGAINLAKKSISNFMELENTVYNLATSSQLGASGITMLRNNLLDMATQSTFSAQQLGNAINDVVRTGQTLESSYKIVRATSKLAIASGEDLSDAVSIVNKIFVALKINANDADKAVQSIHSTAILTSSSLESMGESAKQWIGAVSVFSTLTTKTGKELEDYRLNLMRMGNTFTGILANMGRSGEQSGRLMLCPFVVRTA